MNDSQILIKYEGGDASKNSIEAKYFGQSLQGLDRLVSDSLVIFSLGRLPKRSERSPLVLKAKELKSGSVDVPGVYQEASELLGVGVPILSSIGPEIVGHYVSAVLDHFKGGDSAVDLAINKMAEMHEIALEAMTIVQRDALEKLANVENNRHTEMMGMHDLLRLSIKSSGSPAVDYVAPVGQTVDSVSFYSGDRVPVFANKEDAEAIRESQKLNWLPPEQQTLTTDGFKFHTNGLSIENPEKDGFMMAEVNDPEFEMESNKYTIAAQKRAKIVVLARKGYKNGGLAKIQILDFVKEVDGGSQ